MSTTRSNEGSWYRAKIEFSSERARMFKNGELVAEIINPKLFGKYIGLFNESVQYNHIRIMDCHIKETDIVLAKDTNFPQFRPTNFLLSEELQKLIHIFQVFEIF